MTEKIDRLLAAHPEMEDGPLTYRLRSILFANSSLRVKRAKIIALADEHMAAIAPFSACKVRCSHCCRMSTPIPEHEAMRLRDASGRKMKILPSRSVEEVMKVGQQFVGRTCPFLVDEMCSVYASRPLVCRVHHSLNDDASACEANVSHIPTRAVMMYEPDALELPYMLLNSKVRSDEPWGNIGEFFPE